MRTRLTLPLVVPALLALLLAACSSPSTQGFDGPDASTPTDAGYGNLDVTVVVPDVVAPTAEASIQLIDAAWDFDGFPRPVGYDGSTCLDDDNDGWTTCDGDCDDHDSRRSPGAFEDLGDYVVTSGPNAGQIVNGTGNGVDEDCNGVVDDPRLSCAPALGSADTPTNYARAFDICENPNGKSVTLKGAEFLGTPVAHAMSFSSTAHRITAHMGTSPTYYAPRWPTGLDGNFIFLSNGYADDDVTRPGWGNCSKDWAFTLAGGITLPAGSCNYGGASAIDGQEIDDYIDLKLSLHAPSNASAFTFEFAFFSAEWPSFVGSFFNDHFLAILTSPNHPYDNVAFDALGHCVSVNNNYFQQCDPAAGASPCPLGKADLIDTGFGLQTSCGSASTAGGTGWLHTSAPVTPNADATLELIVFDMGDGTHDSAFIADHFRWLAQNGVTPVTGR